MECLGAHGGIWSQALEKEKEIEVPGVASKKCPLRAKRNGYSKAEAFE